MKGSWSKRLTVGGLIIVGIGLLLKVVSGGGGSGGPVHSADLVFAALDTAGITHHPNPDSASADTPNNCADFVNGENRHVRQSYLTQLSVDSDPQHDVDRFVIAMDNSSSAKTEAASRRSQAAQFAWPTVVHDNLYAELRMPDSQLPGRIIDGVKSAANGVTAPASPAPPVLNCP
jgi:hypothetical protein